MIKLLLVAEGARFAGIEGHLLTLLSEFPSFGVAPRLAVFHHGLLSERAQRLGIPVDRIERRSRYDLQAIDNLAALIRENEIQLVHSHGYLANIIAARAVRPLKIPLITTVHGVREPYGLFAGLKMRFNLYLDSRVMRGTCRMVIAVAEYIAKDLRRRRIPDEKICVIYNGLSPLKENPWARHESRQALELPPDTVAISLVGRLDAVKDPLAFIDFARLVHDVRPRTAFLVAGDGPLLGPMHEKAMEAGLLSKFRFLGFLEDLDPLMAASDLLVLTSQSEGIPLVALEAMRAGVPVLAPAVGGLPELLGELENALAPSRDVAQLAALATRLIGDSPRLRTAGMQAKNLFQRRFTARQMMEKVVAVYRAALEKSS